MGCFTLLLEITLTLSVFLNVSVWGTRLEGKACASVCDYFSLSRPPRPARQKVTMNLTH